VGGKDSNSGIARRATVEEDERFVCIFPCSPVKGEENRSVRGTFRRESVWLWRDWKLDVGGIKGRRIYGQSLESLESSERESGSRILILRSRWEGKLRLLKTG
jgi:hypothetical protein